MSMQQTLVVAIRGWTNTGDRLLWGAPGGEFPEASLDVLRADLPDAEVWAPELDLTMFSMRDPEDVAQELFNLIDAKVLAMPGLASIILVGYSAGSLLARRVFCMAHGAGPDARLDAAHAAPWAGRIQRLVVLAGITRGWQLSTASPDSVRFLSPILFGLARFVGWCKSLSFISQGRLPFIWQLKRGAPFVISTRIQYVEVMRQLRLQRVAATHSLMARGVPSTIFLLGAKDEYISPADCTELGPRAEFAYIELPGSNHAKVLKLIDNAAEDAAECLATHRRRARLVAALSTPFDELLEQPWALPPGDIDDYLDPMDLSEFGVAGAGDGDQVQHAVMVVHGIRDNGFWTKRVAREIKTQGRTAHIKVRAPSPSYGFFSMWDFVRPGGRKNATYWFMERYADVRSHFPNAAISFVGHSNGTYLAAHAMTLCPALRFERIVFAGSVVRQDYPWSQRTTQVGGVLNYVGNADGVVAFMPAVFEFLGLRWLDVGGAGAFGFKEAGSPPAIRQRVGGLQDGQLELTELRYVSGGHGAAIDEQFWPEIAAFVLKDEIPSRFPVPRSPRTRALFAFAPALTTLGLSLAMTVLLLPVLTIAGIALAATNIPGSRTGEGITQLIVEYPLLWLLVALLSVGLTIGISWLARRVLRAW
ncbi:hypothetical protein G8A07_08335 [Roseateles sp. DAIF2]|uniref:hypothetical protein n=1 Tax=Roseateles sp. DAIF2 TaxID=2714952 RepID=UPI0018A30C74|nr:hypothetical protein [Roseateles sp. DAIF2]QPF72936.1 hypothetical protein G8A07_08335 [Roseateles sp. DAIF2]